MVLHDVNLALRFCQHFILLFDDGSHLLGTKDEVIKMLVELGVESEMDKATIYEKQLNNWMVFLKSHMQKKRHTASKELCMAQTKREKETKENVGTRFLMSVTC